jgi:hypothetical protein
MVGMKLGDWKDEHIEALSEDLVAWIMESDHPLIARWLKERRVSPVLVEEWLKKGREDAMKKIASPQKKFAETWAWARLACATSMSEGALYRRLDTGMACRLLPLASDEALAWEREKMSAKVAATNAPQQLELRLSPARESLPAMDGDQVAGTRAIVLKDCGS